MSSVIVDPRQHEIVYPESDGQPMAENTLQFEWIVTIKGGLDAVFRDDLNVFVAGDLLWYPVIGNTVIRQAPDILVVLGRPKGHRGSYRQWEEGGIAPQVVFEILSPGNRPAEMIRKFAFYQMYGVEEYYLIDPEPVELSGWLRDGAVLQEIPSLEGWVSPRLKIRFEIANGDLQIYGPDNRRFATYVELAAERDRALLEVERLRAQLKELGTQPEA